MTSKADNVRPPRGMRDFLPSEMLLRQHLLSVNARVYQAYGYLPIETPVLERLGILMGKGSGENEKLLFKVLKRGEKLDEALAGDKGELADLGLRYDLTVPLARFVAANRSKLPSVFRVQHMAPVWRADRPQKGRFREFMQCDIDVVGGQSADYEIEILTATEEALRELDLGEYVLRLSDKRLLQLLFTDAGADAEQVAAITRAVDKLDKVGLDMVKAEVESAGLAPHVLRLTFDLLTITGEQSLAQFVEHFGKAVIRREEWDLVLAGLRQIIEGMKALNPATAIHFDPLLIRGMDYYTGPVFEVGVKGYSFSVVGGGRYDGLIGRFSKGDICAVGCSIGFDRIMTILQDRGTSSELGRARVRVVIEQGDNTARQRLARELRALDLSVDVDLTGRKFERQLKAAAKECLTHVVVGHDPESGKVTVRDLGKRESVTVDLADVPNVL